MKRKFAREESLSDLSTMMIETTQPLSDQIKFIQLS